MVWVSLLYCKPVRGFGNGDFESKGVVRKTAARTTLRCFELRYEFLELIPLESASQRLELHDALYFERFLFQLLNEFYALLRFCFFISAATDYNCLM